MTHRLDPLLDPASIAVLGASERPGSVGMQTMQNLRLGKFSGRLYAVNPGYQTVCGVDCYADLASLPDPVEHVIFTVSDSHLEAALDEAIAHGVKAVTILSSLIIEEDPGFRERIDAKIQQAGLVVCGANSMGFFNFRSGIWACGFDTRENHVRGGNVTLISQSGSGMCGIVDCEGRIDFNLAISTGQELAVALDEYLDYALEQPETRVVGLFIETVRHPQRMVAALKKAADKQIPIVAIKVGKTEFSARLAITHSGAIAGTDAAYQALFDRYGVQRADDMDELATALIMFAQPHPVGPGSLVTLHDSGGERQLLIDLADELNVPLARISKYTEEALVSFLDPGLPPVNPLDAWGTGGPDSDRIMEDCFSALMADDDSALGAVVHDRAPRGVIYHEYLDYIHKGFSASGKPAFLVANRQGTGSDPMVIKSTRDGFPVLDGLRSFLKGVSFLLAYRDFQQRSPAVTQPVAMETLDKWQSQLRNGNVLDEFESLQLLQEFGLPVNSSRRVNDEQDLAAAASELGFPLVLKSAAPGVQHKTDEAGVKLGLDSETALSQAYNEMILRLGPRVLVAPMITAGGVELVLGMTRDDQFGPLVMLGFGGTGVETLKDVAYAMPPFDAAHARRLLDNLHQRPVLEAQRERPAVAISAFCEAAANFSQLVANLGDALEEIDINPLIVHPDGCIAVDALIAGRANAAVMDLSRRVV